MKMNNCSVRLISRSDCEPYIIGIHYAHRWPSITYRYGLFNNNELIGVCTFGTPASATLKRGVAGDEYKGDVIELNRLCLKYNVKNQASYLVSKSLTMIKENKIIVSYADIAQGHKGIVYQACNFTYYGLSAKRTDWKVRGMEHKHGQTIADEFRGVKNRAQAMRTKYGDDFYLSPRSRKHRYIYVIGDKKYKKKVKLSIKYKAEEYPK